MYINNKTNDTLGSNIFYFINLYLHLQITMYYDESDDSSSCTSSMSSSSSDSKDETPPFSSGNKDKLPPFEICHPPKKDNVIGQEQAKKIFNATILGPTKFPKHQDRFRPKSKVKALLFYGPPGCGKTELAYYCAGQLDAVLLKASGSSLQNKFIGE